MPKNKVCKECTYVPKYKEEIDDNFDFLPENKPNFSV